MRGPFLLSIPIAAALALGCDDPQSPTTPAGNPPPSFRAEHGTTPFNAFSLIDDPYTLVVGTFEDVVAICEERPFDVVMGDQLTVTRPEGQDDFEESIKQFTRAKDVPLTVFEGTAGACDLLAAPHYEGTGQAFIEDNDVLLTHNGANSVNIRVRGTVSNEDGEEYHVLGRVHQVLSKDSTLENFIILNFFVTVKLTPTGG